MLGAVVEQAPELEHRRRQRERHREPGERRGAAHGEDRGDDGREAEQRDDRAAPLGVLEHRQQQDDEDLHGQQERRGLLAQGGRATAPTATECRAGPPRSSSWPHCRTGWATMPVCRAPCCCPSSPARWSSSSAVSRSCAHPRPSTPRSPRSRCPRPSTRTFVRRLVAVGRGGAGSLAGARHGRCARRRREPDPAPLLRLPRARRPRGRAAPSPSTAAASAPSATRGSPG